MEVKPRLRAVSAELDRSEATATGAEKAAGEVAQAEDSEEESGNGDISKVNITKSLVK